MKNRKHRCSECGEPGHSRRTCPKLRASREAAGKLPQKPVKPSHAKVAPSTRRRASDILQEAENQLEAEAAAISETLSQVRAARKALETRAGDA